jgi:hypothetical protein
MKKFIITITIIGCIFSGCEDKNTEQRNLFEDEVITHDITVDKTKGFYFDLASELEVDSSSTWHLSFQMLPVNFGQSVYLMPNLILGPTVLAAEYNDILFDDLLKTPDTFMSDYFEDASVLQYLGANEVIQYNMQNHRASIKNPSRVFVIYETTDQSTYKVQFIEYNRGITAFRHSTL